MGEAACQPAGPPAQRDLVLLEHSDDVRVGVEGVEEHDGGGLVSVRAVAYRDAVRMQGEGDQVGVDAEVVADLPRRPLLVDVQVAQFGGIELDAVAARRTAWLDD